jgi:hypothetical protein
MTRKEINLGIVSGRGDGLVGTGMHQAELMKKKKD